MISRLALRNWRNYHALDVEFAQGTTFVVASNGVGKTSLVEAARWALFGVAPAGGASAIHAGEESATASVELMMPDARRMRVTRTLAKKTRAGAESLTITIDAVEVSQDALEKFLITAYNAEPNFLANLTMPTANPQDGVPSKLGLEDHLGQYYGVTGLRRAIDRLQNDLKETESRIRQVKTANASSAGAMAHLQEAVDSAELQVRKTTEQHQALQQRLERAQEQQRYLAATAKWHEEWTTWTHNRNELASRLSKELGREIPAAGFDAALEAQKAALQKMLEGTRIAIGVNQGRQQAIQANQSRLDSSGHDCPVCRRPLDEDTVVHAHSANNAELADIDEQLQSLQSSESAHYEALERLKRLEADSSRLRQPTEQPAALSSATEEVTGVDDLKTLVEQALNAMVDARAAHVGSVRSLDEARAADQAIRELHELFLREASVRVAMATTESTLSELLNKTIRPLAVEIDLRWRALFPGRGDLTTTANGGISRTVNGHPLPYDAFSTGEGMGAIILMRLLIAQMATSADFCWFDEPLEHLDPDIRRRVANLLARVTTTGGPLRQIVVTTYEERLARQLEARDPQNVKLIDVRQAG
ncbi:MAG: hypothetical protein JWR34_741 [Mycobacterium sp.]|nr:hypothetical protein [Mycobacterium sp.]